MIIMIRDWLYGRRRREKERVEMLRLIRKLESENTVLKMRVKEILGRVVWIQKKMEKR